MLGKRKARPLIPPSKKRKKTFGVEEVVYDESARADYLGGFHKRKVQRVKHAQEEAAKREKQEKLDSRKQLRQARKEDLEKHVAEVNALLKKQKNLGESSDESEGDADEKHHSEADVAPEEDRLDHDVEYLDEDKHTTVTVETVDVTREGLQKVADEQEVDNSDPESHTEGSAVTETARKQIGPAKRVWTKDRPGGPKKKKKKFKYETKAERKETRHKERMGSKKMKAKRAMAET
ncbi:hypothetical protein MMC25_003631 [Agyrium rufum]|nr:hypothetical protein [Agyrium rufum]